MFFNIRNFVIPLNLQASSIFDDSFNYEYRLVFSSRAALKEFLLLGMQNYTRWRCVPTVFVCDYYDLQNLRPEARFSYLLIWQVLITTALELIVKREF